MVSAEALSGPIRIHPGTKIEPGDTFVHRIKGGNDTEPTELQVWVADNGGSWQVVNDPCNYNHPVFTKLVLSISPLGVPIWVLPKTARRRAQTYILHTSYIVTGN